MGKFRNRGLNFNRRKKTTVVNIPILKEVLFTGAQVVVVIFMAFVCVYFFGMRTSVVGQSMADTLKNGDQILVNRFAYKLSNPKENDIIVFYPNGNKKSHFYVKRVVGVPGDTVQIKDGDIYINDKLLHESITVDEIEDAGLAKDKITLSDDEFFVLGDNRNNSEDSRYANIGNIKKEYIVGKAWFVVSTNKRFGFLR